MTERTEQDVLDRIAARRARPARLTDTHITMAHGAGGKASATLVQALFVRALANPVLAALEDSATFPLAGARVATTTDAFVVRPLTFPGGTIGELAVNGTVNDLAAAGARATALTAAFVIEEGLPVEVLSEQVAAMAAAAARCAVPVVAGDTKVVERGKADGLFVVTTGLGEVRVPGLSAASLTPGNRLLCSGPIGAHGMAVLVARSDLEIDADIRSDTRPLWPLVEPLAALPAGSVRAMRDATRGGLATVVNELAASSGVEIVLDETAVVVDPAVRGACELLGIDPLYVANEGVLVAAVAAEHADAVVAAWRRVPGGDRTAVIGEVTAPSPGGRVLLRTGIGGHRVVDMLVGDPLPRIC